jgi:hypothetical protein
MWAVSCRSKAEKPLHHISINPYKDERLTDEQVLKIVKRCEEKYGYKPNNHQRVIVEHIKDGRQHFHVMWNRVSLTTGKVVKSGEHWKKSKQSAREMEKELGLKRAIPRRLQLNRSLQLGIRPIPAFSQPTRPYAGVLGESPETEPKKTKTGKGDKTGDSSGGGMASGNSALKTTKKSKGSKNSGYGKDKMSESNKAGNGPERRRQKMWVPVERRKTL